MTTWLSERIVLDLHDEQLARHGGASGVRDLGLLQSALARPLNLASYGEPDVADLAASYAVAIARNHPFVDGNKRAAFMAMVLFLALNDMELEASEPEATVAMLDMAAGQLTDTEFTLWVREHAQPRG